MIKQPNLQICLPLYRFSRGLQTLTELLKQASKGVMISEEDIPPEVSLKKSEPKPNPVFGLAGKEIFSHNLVLFALFCSLW